MSGPIISAKLVVFRGLMDLLKKVLTKELSSFTRGLMDLLKKVLRNELSSFTRGLMDLLKKVLTNELSSFTRGLMDLLKKVLTNELSSFTRGLMDLLKKVLTNELSSFTNKRFYSIYHTSILFSREIMSYLLKRFTRGHSDHRLPESPKSYHSLISLP